MAGIETALERARARRDEASRLYEALHTPKQAAPTVSTSDQVRSRPARQEPKPLPRPQLPIVRPMVSPNMDLKRETANFWDFTPAARTELYDTPTQIKYFAPAKDEQGNVSVGLDPQGYYRHTYPEGEHQIMVHEPYGNRPLTSSSTFGNIDWPSLSAGTLAHEFGHKWDAEHVPDYLRQDWYDKGWQGSHVWGPSFYAKVNTDPSFSGNAHALAQETYANSVMQNRTPGMEMDPSFRDKYFAGLFNSGASRWPGPPPPPPSSISDVLRDRDVTFRSPDASGAWG